MVGLRPNQPGNLAHPGTTKISPNRKNQVDQLSPRGKDLVKPCPAKNRENNQTKTWAWTRLKKLGLEDKNHGGHKNMGSRGNNQNRL